MRTFRAKYSGRCAGCGGGFNVGDMIAWTRKEGKGISYHVNCEPPPAPRQDGEPAPVDDENSAHQEYLADLEYYKDEPDFF